jgi:hypothetical protein
LAWAIVYYLEIGSPEPQRGNIQKFPRFLFYINHLSRELISIILEQMKTLRLIGMAILAIVMCVNFTACSDNEEDDKSTNAVSLIGKWKIETAVKNGETEEWDGHPYYVVTDTHFYFTDEDNDIKSDYCTYTYDADSKVMYGKYVNQDTSWNMNVVSLSNSTASFQWDEDGDGTKMITINCKRVQ